MRALALTLVLFGCAAHRSTLVLARPMTPARFDELAQRRDLPLYWRDDDGDGVPTSDELRALLFYGVPGAVEPEPVWVEHGDFTPALMHAVDEIFAEDLAPVPTDLRRALVREQLDLGQPDLIETDASEWSSEDRELVRRMIVATDRIDALFARQRGLDALRPRLDPSDTIARAYFRTGWSPQCPSTVDPVCSAIEGAPLLVIDPWPAALQDGTNGFCAAMLASPELRSPFTVVRPGRNGMDGIPYPQAYADLVRSAAEALLYAADALGARDAVVAEYLRAVAVDLESGSYTASGVAPRLAASGSEWFVDAGADGRVAWDVCHRKAAYHLTLGRFDHASATLSDRITSHATELASALLALAPAAQAIHPPDLRRSDFVRIVLVGGDDRRVTVDGSSTLHRSVVYTNSSTSPENVQRVLAGRARFLADPSLMQLTPEHADASRLMSALHETSHDLAPAFESDARTTVPAHELLHLLREVYAESAARYLAVWLGERAVIDAPTVDAMLRESIGYDISWLGASMYGRTGARRDPAQAALIRLGLLADLGVVRWDPEVSTADGAFRGAILVDLDALRSTGAEVMRRVLQLLAARDWTTIEALVARYVDHSPLPLSDLARRTVTAPYSQLVFSIRW